MSRPRSARGNAAPARGAAQGRGVFVSAPKSDIYVVMLAVALGAMFLGTLLMVMLMSRYDFKVKPAALTQPAATAQLV